MGSHPELERFFENFIEPSLGCSRGERNAWLVKKLPFYYRAVAPVVALEIARLFYHWNAGVFRASESDHMDDARALLKGLDRTFECELSTEEKDVFLALAPTDQAAFRIFRDLSIRGKGMFSMGICHLAARLGVSSNKAQGILSRFEGILITRLAKGERRAEGVTPKAGRFQWLLALPTQTLTTTTETP